jgi:hypothetical protein
MNKQVTVFHFIRNIRKVMPYHTMMYLDLFQLFSVASMTNIGMMKADKNNQNQNNKYKKENN